MTSELLFAFKSRKSLPSCLLLLSAAVVLNLNRPLLYLLLISIVLLLPSDPPVLCSWVVTLPMLLLLLTGVVVLFFHILLRCLGELLLTEEWLFLLVALGLVFEVWLSCPDFLVTLVFLLSLVFLTYVLFVLEYLLGRRLVFLWLLGLDFFDNYLLSNFRILLLLKTFELAEALSETSAGQVLLQLNRSPSYGVL